MRENVFTGITILTKSYKKVGLKYSGGFYYGVIVGCLHTYTVFENLQAKRFIKKDEEPSSSPPLQNMIFKMLMCQILFRQGFLFLAPSNIRKMRCIDV